MSLKNFLNPLAGFWQRIMPAFSQLTFDRVQRCSHALLYRLTPDHKCSVFPGLRTEMRKARLWVRLREKGGKRHEMPCHHNLEEYLVAYIDGTGLRDDPKGLLFRTIGRGTGQLTASPLAQANANAHAMIQRRMIAAGIATKAGNHSFRATGITAYLKNGGSLEKAAVMANHSSTRTTQLYDRRHDEMTLDEVEKIGI